MGINLTAACRLIVYDELWNPVHNAQVSILASIRCKVLEAYLHVMQPLPAQLRDPMSPIHTRHDQSLAFSLDFDVCTRVAGVWQ